MLYSTSTIAMPSCFCYVNSATLNIQSLTSESNFKSKRPGSSNLNFYFVPFWYIYNNVVPWREVQYIFILKTHRKTLTKNLTLKPILMQKKVLLKMCKTCFVDRKNFKIFLNIFWTTIKNVKNILTFICFLEIQRSLVKILVMYTNIY